VDDPDHLATLIEVLEAAASIAPVVFPVHPRTRERLESAGTLTSLEGRGIRPTEPLGYLDMIRLVRAARAVITDSGGVQKEAFLAAAPCLTMREETEWVETVEAGWNRLIGLRADAVRSALDELPQPGEPSPAAEIYGGGRAGERVAEAVADWLT
jgi:UDP-N-acetylglucosamine 2-epimerase